MPDLDDPAAPGTRMQPKFFLTDAKLPFGTPDAERRGTLAEWMTDNPWFADRVVNRMWAELVGEGFYEPIDDIGPERTPSAPKAVDFLSRSFAESGYDVKWLFRVICATDAYQRESRPRRDVGWHAVRRQRGPAAAERPAVQRDADGGRCGRIRRADGTAAGAASAGVADSYGRNATVRKAFEAAFGYDPSDPRETVTSSIPQALAMMNGARINLAVRAVGPRHGARPAAEGDEGQRRPR